MSFREEEETPGTPTEFAIENILINNNVIQDEIQFRDSMFDFKRYLRIGYWEQLNENILSQLKEFDITEGIIWDEDCGNLYYYNFKNQKA